MTMYYSLSTKGFYDTELVDYPSLPTDIIEITKEQHLHFIHNINMENKELILQNGSLVLQDLIRIPTWSEIRVKRNSLLVSSDYTQMSDFPGDKTTWATYRQTLRDIPSTYGNTEDVIFPTAPGE
jgi:hypothetical protein